MCVCVSVYCSADGTSRDAVLTLHHLHLLPQRHPQSPGGRVCQEVPRVLISGLGGDAVFRFVLVLLTEAEWR